MKWTQYVDNTPFTFAMLVADIEVGHTQSIIPDSGHMSARPPRVPGPLKRDHNGWRGFNCSCLETHSTRAGNRARGRGGGVKLSADDSLHH